MPTVKKFQTLFYALLLLNFTLSAFAFAPKASAQNTSPQQSIQELLCAPSENADPSSRTELFSCINRIYKFIIAIGSVAAVFFLVVAGYLYMASDGSAESVTKAKEILVSTVTGMVIILITFVFLQQINPELIKFPQLQLEQITDSNLPSPYEECRQRYEGDADAIAKNCNNLSKVSPGARSGGGGNPGCSVTAGTLPCSKDRMSSCPAWQSQTELASKICNLESAGGRNLAIPSGTDKCKDGNSWSYGLWQINMIAHGGQNYMPKACPAGIFQTNGRGTQGECIEKNSRGICIKYDCSLKSGQEGNYQSCIQALANADTQMKIACGLYTKRGNWGDWRTSYNACK